MNIVFFKIADGRWYAYLPEYLDGGGSMDDCEMVAGADIWLDILAGEKTSLTIKVETEPFEGANQLTLDRVEYGAYYFAPYKNTVMEMWLCPVTLHVFGKYPQIIYYK